MKNIPSASVISFKRFFDNIRSDTKDNSISAATLYLFLPNILFIVLWVRPSIAIPVLLVVALYCYKNRNNFSFLTTGLNKINFWALLCALAITVLSGIGEIGYQTFDFEKHNIIFKDLTTFDNPVTYADGSHLAYYIAYYLPATSLGKITSENYIPFFNFIWSLWGIYILFEWIIGRFGLKGILFFVFFGGFYVNILPEMTLEFKKTLDFLNRENVMRFITKYFVNLQNSRYLIGDKTLGTGLLYNGNLVQLFWAPHSTIAGWVLTTSLIENAKKKSNYLGLDAICTILFSPFLFIGSMPYILYIYWKNKWIGLVNNVNLLITLPILVILLAYFQSNGGENGFASQFNNIFSKDSFLTYLSFLFFSFGIFFVIIFLFKKEKFKMASLLYISCLTLMFLPFIRMGIFNDWIVRTSTIPMLIFSICIFSNLSTFLTYKLTFKSIIVYCLILVCSFESFQTIFRGVYYFNQKNEYSISKVNKNINEYSIMLFNHKIDISQQYLGKKDSFFRKYISK